MKKAYLYALLIIILSGFLATVTSFSTDSEVQRFLDVNKGDWFFSDVEYVYEKGLMSGTGDDTFSPGDSTTRGMIATVLWRMEGSPDAENLPFEDVSEDAYYAKAVAWCLENEIASGYSDTVFGPDDIITREQLATMIYRYADYRGIELSQDDLSDEYLDADKVSIYARIPFEWAIQNGIISGTSSTTLSPQDNALRCQVAAILKRFSERFDDESDEVKKEPEKTAKATEKVNIIKGGTTSGKISSDDKKQEEESYPESFPVIFASNVTAKQGECVQVAVGVKNNPGILGMILSVYFNEEALLLKSVESGEALSVLDFTTSKTLENGARFIWDGVEIASDEVADGDILLLNFEVKADAVTGKYPITVKYAEGDILDNDLKTVTPAVESGYITVI